MKDNELSPLMQVLLIIATTINLIYNIPQIFHTYKTKSTKDFSSLFILLRIIGNGIWIVYGIVTESIMMTVNNVITVGASLFLAYYKINEYKNKKYILPIINDKIDKK